MIEFNKQEDIISYFSEKTKDENKFQVHSIYISDCIFQFELDLNLLLSSLLYEWPNARYIGFANATYMKKVELMTHNKDEIDILLDFSNSHFLEEVDIHGYMFKRDVNFITCVFEKKTIFQENTFKQYFRLFGSSFNTDVIFAYSELNNIVLFSNDKDIVQFRGNVNFWGAKFKICKFWDFVFEKDVYFNNVIFDGPVFFNRTVFQGKVEFGSVETIGKTEFKENVYFNQAIINEISFTNILFDVYVSFNEATIKKIKVDNVVFNKTALSLSGTTIDNVADEQSARLLKYEAIRASNQYMALELKAKELRLLNKHLPLSLKNLKEKIVLTSNYLSNDYGQDWIRGIIFTIVSWIIFFSLFIIIRDGWGNTFIWSESYYLKEAANYFWILNGMEGFGSKTNWVEFIIFFLGKIFIGYGIYQTISAFRKYGR
jgi:hypothetical protein